MSDWNFNDPTSTPNAVDDMISQAVGSLIRHGASYAAGILLAAGAIQPDQKAQAIAVIASLGLWAASQTWSLLSKRRK